MSARMSPEEHERRFWLKVDKTDTCWLWTGSVNNNGYGWVGGGKRSPVAVHRFSYELTYGEIPAGLVIDHLCSVRTCVNPEHMEAVTQAENTRRAQGWKNGKCRRDHELAVSIEPMGYSGKMRCGECARIRNLGYYYQKRAAS